MLNFTIDLAKKAGEVILSEKKHLTVDKKSRREIVTNADVASEKFITHSILEKFGSHHILGEETFQKDKNYQKFSDLWIIDPIDGTTNFAQGLTEYAVSIGYYHDQKPVVGVVFFPEKNMLFTAESGKGASLNDKKIEVAQKQDVKDVVFSGLFSYETEENVVVLDIAKKLYPQIKTMRFMGSAVLDICFTAAGILDGTFGFSLKPWDMAAGYIIATEAGAEVSTLKGEKWTLFQPEMLVTNKFIHPFFVNFFSQILLV
ncbi:hypothetical protein A2773_03180 [Candidatus Gottesmanbacteria bacterium RIFCSPHIGHO2_01_FULL_39_10]|uniref:Inositol-1-monophosphatase n=1 Tax=Candidatus Gottesmanbacteria bacterium RIFCSPHIGHO2_01_FULL_39_10 TaxID=1798375 RepID=A0A1F5ZLW4_9BACT|nr:MAG: hypothetical protein A2773_03180 [Candidatus Gottesmanbacteria bacterium RIFCSPHIGHO2_01_FULL_39_10]